MRKLLLLLVLGMLSVLARGQNPGTFMPSCRYAYVFTTTGRSAAYNNITPSGSVNTSCTNWTAVYSSVGFSALSLEVDSAPDNGTAPGLSQGSWTIWPAAQIAAGQVMPLTSLTSAGLTFFGFFPWLSINVTTATCPASTSCQGNVYIYGWQTQGSQESNTGATQTQGVTAAGSFPTGNPVQVALNSPTSPWQCSLTGLAATLTQCKAAPTAGRLYITDITVDTTTATAGTYQLETGTGTNCATGTATLYPSFAGAWTAPVLGAPQKINFQTPLQPPTLAAVCVIGTATNTINVQLQGFIAP